VEELANPVALGQRTGRRVREALRRGKRLALLFRDSFRHALRHDAMNLSQSASYSAIVSLFPALIVIAALIALLPDVAPLKIEIGNFFDELLPRNTFSLLTTYFVSSPGDPHPRTIGSILLAAIVSFTGGSSVLAILMEGIRRAHGLPRNCWTFWQRRRRALLLVPLSLIPFAVATLLVVFGRFMTEWLAAYLWKDVQPVFLAVALAIRWTIALAGVVGLTAMIYHYGCVSPRRKLEALPGAVVATAMWFVSTIAFGWYVTRFANYNLIYGSLGAGIALLFWLQLVFLSVLCGAEFNALCFPHQES
jgi:membrane protein